MISVQERELMIAWYEQLLGELAADHPSRADFAERLALLRSLNPATLPNIPSPRAAQAA